MRVPWLLVLCSLAAPTASSLSLRSSSPPTHGPAANSSLTAPTHAKDGVHVAYTVTHHVFNSTLRSMLSLSLHNEAPNLTIHVLVPPADVQRARDMRRCLQQRLASAHLRGGKPEVEITSMWRTPFQLESPRPDIEIGHVGSQGRLFLQDYLPQVHRVLYLDSDTIVMGDVSELYDRHMVQPLAAAFSMIPTLKIFIERYCPGLHFEVDDEHRKLFNDGVMLLDLDRWRRDNISRELTKMTHSVEGSDCSTQLMLNVDFQYHRQGFDLLENKWNKCFNAKDLDSMKQDYDENIAHFVSSPKPWYNETIQGQWFSLFRKHWMPGGDAEVKSGSATSGACANFQL